MPLVSMKTDIGTRCQNTSTEALPIHYFSLDEVDMSQADTQVIAPDAAVAEEIQDDQFVVDDELVEEISIDGMCGVY